MLFQLSCCFSDSEMLPACSLDWTSFVTAEQMKPGKLELVSAPCQSKSGITFPHPGAVLVKTRFSLHHNRLYLQVNLTLSSSPHNETGSLPFLCLSNLHLNFLTVSLSSSLIRGPQLSIMSLVHSCCWLHRCAVASSDFFGIESQTATNNLTCCVY